MKFLTVISMQHETQATPIRMKWKPQSRKVIIKKYAQNIHFNGAIQIMETLLLARNCARVSAVCDKKVI